MFSKLVSYTRATPPAMMAERLAARIRGRSRLKAFDNTVPLFFVLSTGRTGTQTLQRLLSQCDGVLIYHCPHPHVEALSRLAYLLEGQHAFELGFMFEEIRRPLTHHALACGCGYGETGPEATFLAPAIAQQFPSAKFVHLHRDARQVLRSAMRRRWYSGHSLDPVRLIPPPNDKAKSVWEQWGAFEKNAWLWAETNRFIRAFGTTVQKHRFTELKAQDLFSGNEASLRRLATFLGLTLPSARVTKRILAKRINKQEEGQFPKPAEWGPDLTQTLWKIAGDEMLKLGYENPGAGPAA